MGRISLIISAILSFIVSIWNLTDHKYLNGLFGLFIFVSTLIALIGELMKK
jgi:hypothetical protein